MLFRKRKEFHPVVMFAVVAVLFFVVNLVSQRFTGRVVLDQNEAIIGSVATGLIVTVIAWYRERGFARLEKKLHKIRKMSDASFIAWVLGKFLIGLGLGMMVATYFQGHAYYFYGWAFIVLAIIVSIPAMKAACRK